MTDRQQHIDTLAEAIRAACAGPAIYRNDVAAALFDSTDPAVHDALTAILHANADRTRVLAAHADHGWLDEETYRSTFTPSTWKRFVEPVWREAQP